MKIPRWPQPHNDPPVVPLPPGLKAFLAELRTEYGPPFKPEEILHVLLGLRGSSPRVNLVRALGELAEASRENRDGGPRRRSARENRQLGHIKALVKAFRFTSEEHRALVLAILEEERRDLDAPRRVRRHRLAGFGITQPKGGAQRQLLWSYPIVNLVEHLKKVGVAREKDRFRIVARLLHLFRPDLFPDNVALVKARYQRSP